MELETGLVAGFLTLTAFFAGWMVYAIVTKPKKPQPTSWSHTGLTPPPNTDIALQVIQERLALIPAQDRRFGGIIEWVKDPYPAGGYYGVLAAGTVEDFYTPYIKLMYFEKVWQSALAHEILHVFWVRANGGKADGEGDPAFYKWIADTNSAIERRVNVR